MKKLFSIIIAAILLVSVTSSCNGNNSVKDTETNDKLNPQTPEQVASQVINYKPESGYNYYKVIDIPSSVEGTMYELKDKTSSNAVGSVFMSSKYGNVVEIDINTKYSNDEGIKSAIKMAVDTVKSVFPKFNANDYPDFPLNYKAVKALIDGNENKSDCIYGTDTTSSLSYEFYSLNGFLVIFIEY